ncbi:MAG TPA: LamG domain-containing protein, partial [Kofleriaceae bacterium]
GFGGAGDAGVIDAPDGARLPFDISPLDGPLPSGLVVWFPLDDMAANNAQDVVSGFNGTCAGTLCPTPTAGHHGGAFLFDGTDDCIEDVDRGQFGQAQITIAIWMRQDIVDACSAVAKRVDVSTTALDSWQLETTTGNQVTLTTHHNSGNVKIVSASNAFVVGQWHHVAATYDGADRRLYVDGTLVTNAFANGPIGYDSHSAWIGCDDNGTAGFALHFNGALDDFQVYNRALTQTEIQMLAAM